MSPRFEMTGPIKRIFNTQTFGSGFTKREFVIVDVDDSGRGFDQPIKFSMTKDQCSVLDNFKENDVVKVTFSINGREWQKPGAPEPVYFNDLHAFKVERADAAEDASAPAAAAAAPASAAAPAAPAASVQDVDPDGDLPF